MIDLTYFRTTATPSQPTCNLNHWFIFRQPDTKYKKQYCVWTLNNNIKLYNLYFLRFLQQNVMNFFNLFLRAVQIKIIADNEFPPPNLCENSI